MEQTKINQLVIQGVGVFFISVCFFLDSARFYQSDSGYTVECTMSFTAKMECVYDGQYIMEYDLGDCQGDAYCNTQKMTPVLGGLSLGLGIIVMVIFYLEDHLIQRYSKKYVKYGLLGLVFVTAILQMLIPILNIENTPSSFNLVGLTVFFEFVTLICYCTFGCWILYQEQQKQQTLLS